MCHRIPEAYPQSLGLYDDNLRSDTAGEKQLKPASAAPDCDFGGIYANGFTHVCCVHCSTLFSHAFPVGFLMISPCSTGWVCGILEGISSI